jgi:hypothetical protein
MQNDGTAALADLEFTVKASTLESGTRQSPNRYFIDESSVWNATEPIV